MRFLRFTAILMSLAVLVSCNRDPKKTAQSNLDRGNRYYDRGNFKAARIMYTNAVKADGKFGMGWYKLGLTQLKLQNIGGAIGPFRRAMELMPPASPEGIDSNVKYAEIELLAAQSPDLGDRATKAIDEVRGIKDKLLKQDPNSFEGIKLEGELTLNDALILGRKGKAPEAKAKIEEALAIYQRALKIKPDDTTAMLALAKCLTLDSELGEAEQLYRRVIDKDKTLIAPYNELYRLYLAEHKVQDAENILKKAIATHPQDYNLQTLLALHYFSANDRTEMTKVLNNLKAHYKDYPDAYLKAGDFYFRIGDADQAIRQYQEGMGVDGARKVDYQKRIIEALIRQGKTAQAYERDLEILKANPKDAEARGLKASFLLDKGDIDAAIVELQSVVTAKPDNFVALFNLGRAYFAKGELEQARLRFEAALKQRPDYMPARLALTQLSLRKGDADAALREAQETLRMNPTSGVATLLEAAAYLRKGDYDNAREILNKILKVNPNQADTLLEMAVLNLEEKKFKEAEEPFRKAYTVDPSNLRGLVGMAEVHFRLKEPDKAVALIAAEVQKFPQRADMKKELATAEARAEMYDKAIADYQSVADRYKDSPSDQAEIMANIAVIYREKKDMQRALDYMEKAKQLAPSSVGYMSSVAEFLDQAGKHNEALLAYRDALKLNPNNPIVLNNLAYLMTQTNGNLDEALTLAQRAKQQLPTLNQVSDTIGWIYIKKNLSDSAIEIFKDLVLKDPKEPAFHLHYGMALVQKGDKANALKQFKEALQYPNKLSKDDASQANDLIHKIS